MASLNPQDWVGCTIILDEVESVIDHLLLGDTCKDERPELMRIFGTLIRGAKRVLFADAGLTNVAVDYLEAIRDEKAMGLVNTYKPEPRQVYIYWGKDGKGQYEEMIAKAIGDIESGKRIVIATDSQAEAEVIHQQLINRGCTNGRRIDSTTKNDTENRSILDDPNDTLAKLRLGYLIYSPAIGAGVSIEGDLFDAVYFVGRGVLTSSAVMQMLGRVRANVPWHICVPESGFSDNKNPYETVAEVIARWQWNAMTDFGLQGEDDFRKFLKDSFPPAFWQMRPDKGYTERIDSIIKSFWRIVGTVETGHHIAQARIKVRCNYELRRLRDTLLEMLAANGCVINEGCAGEVGKEFGQERKEIREELKEKAAQRILDVPLIDVKTARKVLKDDRSTQSEREAAIKTLLLYRLPGVNVSLELIRRCCVDNKGRWLRGVENQWLWSHPEVLQDRNFDAWHNRIYWCVRSQRHFILR